MATEKIKLAFLTSHPTQYHSPFFRVLDREPGIDLSVLYCRDFGIGKKSWDPGFGEKISWDIPLLEGYRYWFLPNWSPRPASGITGQINPGIFAWLRRHRPDVLVVHGWMTASNWLALGAARALSIPIILKGEADLLRRGSPLRRALRKGRGRILAGCAAALYSCRANREYFTKMGFPERKLFFFPAAVDNDFFQAAARRPVPRPGLREKLGLPEGTTLVLSSGKLIPRKRPLDLVRAVLGLPRETPAALVLLGDGRLRGEIEAFPEAGGKVFVTGFVNQGKISDYYRQADVFTLASEWDPSPKALNEAMNFSLPLLVSDRVGTGADLVEPGRNGYLFPVGDIRELERRILELASDPGLREKLGKRSREIVTGWSFAAQAAGVRRAAESVLGRAG